MVTYIFSFFFNLVEKNAIDRLRNGLLQRRPGARFSKLPVITGPVKDVRAHCYCASLVRTLVIGLARATSFSSARTESKAQINIELMTFALTLCENIFVGCSVTPTFYLADHFLF